MIRIFSELLKNRDAFLTLVQLHLKTSVSRTALGYLWWLLDPLFLMAVYYFLVKIIFQGEEKITTCSSSMALSLGSFSPGLSVSPRGQLAPTAR